MKPDTRQLLHKASRAISSAERLAVAGDLDFAASRAYYAFFYVAEALLLERDKAFSKHSGVHAALGEHFVKAGRLDSKYHRWLLDAFDKRLHADYGLEVTLTAEEVDVMISHAREFLGEAERLLG